MKLNGRNFRSRFALPFCALLSLTAGLLSSSARPYEVGDIVTNFTVYTRVKWTSPAGKIFMAGSPIRLSDFAGQIVFFEFFDPT
jgi:hypothetical protein